MRAAYKLKTVAVVSVSVLSLAACSTFSFSGNTRIIDSTTKHVDLMVSNPEDLGSNVYDMANEHCGKFGKIAKLEKTTTSGQSRGVAYFKCLTPGKPAPKT